MRQRYAPMPRQIEMLALIADGLTVDQAARRLSIHPNAASDRLRRLRYRIGAETTAHAVALCMQAGWLPGVTSSFNVREWPDELVRTAHNLFKREDESDVVMAGEREYQRRRRARTRDSRRVSRTIHSVHRAPESKTVDEELDSGVSACHGAPAKEVS